MIGRLGKPYSFLGERLPLAKGAALNKGGDEEAGGEHRGQPGQAETLLAQRAVETRHVFLKALHGPTIVPRLR